MNQGHKIILYDDDCLLCNRIVQYILTRDQEEVFLFADLNKQKVQNYLRQQHPEVLEKDSIVLLDANQPLRIEFPAVLAISKQLKTPWHILLAILSILPDSILNFGYRFVAQNRKRIISQKQCSIADSRFANRIL